MANGGSFDAGHKCGGSFKPGALDDMEVRGKELAYLQFKRLPFFG